MTAAFTQPRYSSQVGVFCKESVCLITELKGKSCRLPLIWGQPNVRHSGKWPASVHTVFAERIRMISRIPYRPWRNSTIRGAIAVRKIWTGSPGRPMQTRWTGVDKRTASSCVAPYRSIVEGWVRACPNCGNHFSIQRLYNRAVRIDHGESRMEGNVNEVVHEYEGFIESHVSIEGFHRSSECKRS